MFTNFRPWMSIYQHVIHSAPRPGHAILDKFCANIQTQLPQGPIAGDLEVITCKNVSFAALLTLVLFITNGHWIWHLVELLPWWSRYFVSCVRWEDIGLESVLRALGWNPVRYYHFCYFLTKWLGISGFWGEVSDFITHRCDGSWWATIHGSGMYF